MNDKDTKIFLHLFKMLIACLIACFVGIILFNIIVFIIQIFDITGSYGHDLFIAFSTLSISISLLTVLAFVGNFSIALCAKSIKSIYVAFLIGGISGAVTLPLFLISFTIYHIRDVGTDFIYSNIIFFIVCLTIGFIFGLMGSFVFILYDKKYLGAGLLEEKRVPFSTIAIAVIILITAILAILLTVV